MFWKHLGRSMENQRKWMYNFRFKSISNDVCWKGFKIICFEKGWTKYMQTSVLIQTFFNPFLHIDAFWCLCSRRLFEKIVTKEEIGQKKQFLLLPLCFPLLVLSYPFNYRDYPFLTKYVQSRLLQNCQMRETVKTLQ